MAAHESITPVERVLMLLDTPQEKLDRIRRERDRGFLPSVADVDFLLGLIDDLLRQLGARP